jgi:hypothetical protein
VVLVGEVKADPWASVVGARTAPDPVKAGYPKRCGEIPLLLRLSDRSESNVGEGLGLQRTQSSHPPAPLLLLYTRSATVAHNHQLVDAPDQGARLNGPRLGLRPLDGRWGQSNTIVQSRLRSYNNKMQEKMRGDGACGKRLEIVQNQDQQAGY